MRLFLLLGVISSSPLLICESVLAQPWTEVQKIYPSNPEIEDYFGISVALDGDVGLVGSAWKDDAGTDAGAGFVYRFDGTAWIEEQALTASDAVDDQLLGYGAALSGDVAVFGAPTAEFIGGVGSAYVFRYDGTQWNEEQKLVPSDGDVGDQFGWAVAIDEDVIVVGAMDDDLALNGGAVYVFRHDGIQWVEEQKLTALDPAQDDWFGQAIDIEGDVIAVGSVQDDDLGTDSGSAFVFRYDGTMWFEEEKLNALNGEAGDAFGRSVSISGDTIAVGAYTEAPLPGSPPVPVSQVGAVYVFGYDGADWSQEQRIPPDLITAWFGVSVALEGDTLVAGSYFIAGEAFVYRYNGATWEFEESIVTTDWNPSDAFCYSVSMSEGRFLAGASRDSDVADLTGAAYFYEGPPPGVFDPSCSGDPAGVQLSWSSPIVYTQIEIRRAGFLIATLPGDATEFFDAGIQEGESYNYQITTYAGTFAMTPVSCFITIPVYPHFSRGDTNDDGSFDVSDPIYTLAALFVPGSPQPVCVDAADANDDGAFDISDAVYSLFALFVPGSPPPAAPVSCDWDPTPDSIDCATSSCP